MDISRFLAILGLIVIGVASRLLPHPPNFTSINAIALLSAFYLGNRWFSFSTVFLTVFLSDALLGFHALMPFVYLSFAFMIGMGYKLKSRISIQSLPFVSGAASLLFFLMTNFGEWIISPLYPKTIEGLGLCYLAATPFLVNQVLGDMTYCLLLFGCFHLWENSFPAKNLFYRNRFTIR